MKSAFKMQMLSAKTTNQREKRTLVDKPLWAQQNDRSLLALGHAFEFDDLMFT